MDNVVDPLLTGGISAGAILTALVWLGKRFLAHLQTGNDRLEQRLGEERQAYQDLTARYLASSEAMQERFHSALSANTEALRDLGKQWQNGCPALEKVLKAPDIHLRDPE